MYLPHWPEIKGFRDIRFGLDRVLQLLERLDNPHEKLPPTIHVAGTNGKGSTLAYLEAILNDAGYKAHKYTSPHLVNFNERIILCGKQISDSYLHNIINECERVANVEPKIEVTFFEGITVAAFLAFSRVKADVLLLETGMGGRLDATNVINNPIVTIITSISLDHCEYLGNSLKEIATEKAGIIKRNSPVITSNKNEEILEVICKKADQVNNSLVFYLGKHFDYQINQDGVHFFINNSTIKTDFPSLLGGHQIENASLAIATLQTQHHFKVNTKNIKNGLKNAKWRGRIEKIMDGKIKNLLSENYELFIDGGHNPQAARIISSWVLRENANLVKNQKQKPNTYLICAMLKDKDAKGFFDNLAGVSDFVIGLPLKDSSHAFSAIAIAKQAFNSGVKSSFVDSFEEAFQYIDAIHNGDDWEKKNFIHKMFKKKNVNPARIIICGSLYLVGEFLRQNQGLIPK